MFVVTHKKIFFAISAVIVGLSIGALLIFGVRPGIDFTGGTLLEVSYDERPEKAAIESGLNTLELGNYSLREAQNEEGKDAFIVRTRDITDAEHQEILKVLSLDESIAATEERFTTIGPTIGQELTNKAFVAIGIVILIIVLFIAFTFRGVSKPVASWKYGCIAIVALVHDVIVPVGAFAVLGVLFGAEIDVLFVMALLAILGYSVNDTIVVFDRVRENLKANQDSNIHEPFELTVGKSLNQTIVRSINTSITTGLVLLTLLILGGSTTQYFALTLLVGVAAGTYSSIALAAPLLVALNDFEKQKKGKK